MCGMLTTQKTFLFVIHNRAEEFDYLLWCVLLYYKDFLELNNALSTQDAFQWYLQTINKLLIKLFVNLGLQLSWT